MSFFDLATYLWIAPPAVRQGKMDPEHEENSGDAVADLEMALNRKLGGHCPGQNHAHGLSGCLPILTDSKTEVGYINVLEILGAIRDGVMGQLQAVMLSTRSKAHKGTWPDESGYGSQLTTAKTGWRQYPSGSPLNLGTGMVANADWGMGSRSQVERLNQTARAYCEIVRTVISKEMIHQVAE